MQTFTDNKSQPGTSVIFSYLCTSPPSQYWFMGVEEDTFFLSSTFSNSDNGKQYYLIVKEQAYMKK